MDKKTIIEAAEKWCKEHYMYYIISSLDDAEDTFYRIGKNLFKITA